MVFTRVSQEPKVQDLELLLSEIQFDTNREKVHNQTLMNYSGQTPIIVVLELNCPFQTNWTAQRIQNWVENISEAAKGENKLLTNLGSCEKINFEKV